MEPSRKLEVLEEPALLEDTDAITKQPAKGNAETGQENCRTTDAGSGKDAPCSLSGSDSDRALVVEKARTATAPEAAGNVPEASPAVQTTNMPYMPGWMP